jgi:hypothetical protein
LRKSQSLVIYVEVFYFGTFPLGEDGFSSAEEGVAAAMARRGEEAERFVVPKPGETLTIFSDGSSVRSVPSQ